MEDVSKHEKILKAALILFVDRGFDGTTVSMIAEKAEVGAGTIYRYFENKEAIVNVLFQKYVKRATEFVKRNYPYNSDIYSQFSHLFHALIQFVKENINALYFIDKNLNAHYLNNTSRELLQQLKDHIDNLFELGKQQNVFRNLPSEVLMAIIWGSINGFYKAVDIGEIRETTEIIESLKKCCWDAIRDH
jgi:AcrR family transcriptional regulator